MKRGLIAGTVLVLMAIPAVCMHAADPPVDIGMDPRLGAQVPGELQLVDHTGASMSLQETIDGKPTVLVPCYYQCPMLCGLNLNAVHTAATGMTELRAGEDYRLLALSFDPTDTPARAAARRTSVIGEDGEPSWRFAVIHPAHQQEYLRAIGWRVQQDPETGKFAHPAGFLVLTGDGRIAQQIYGLETAPEEPRLALVEAGEGSIGTLGDRMLLMCYHYDTASRRYAVAMSTFYRAGGLAIMLGSGVGLWFLVRRARRRRQS